MPEELLYKYVCCTVFMTLMDHFVVISGLQIYYLSSTNADGTDDQCEQLGWKRLQDYNPEQKGWKYLNTLAERNALDDDNSIHEDELEEEDYYASLPFAALFSCFKVKSLKPNKHITHTIQHFQSLHGKN